ncbi:MAG: hypothetical protein ACPGSD_16075 [Flavobacteriales bacterium]
MKNKERYMNALIKNNGKLNEIDLGEKLFIDANDTMEIISQLLSEYKIVYETYGVCNYKVIKKPNGK